MNESEAANSYTIDINRTTYTFSCTDGEEHVLKLRKKLTQVVESLTSQESGHSLSNTAMKIALLLADEAVREGTNRLNQQEEVESKVISLIDELDFVLSTE